LIYKKNKHRILFFFVILVLNLLIIYPISYFLVNYSTKNDIILKNKAGFPDSFILKYLITGDQILLEGEEFQSKGSYQSVIKLNCSLNGDFLIVKYREIAEISFWTELITNTWLINIITGESNNSDSSSWIIFDFPKEMELMNNCSRSPIHLLKTHKEAVISNISNEYIKCQVYTHVVDSSTESLRLLYYLLKRLLLDFRFL